MLSAEASVGYSTEPLEHPKRYILTALNMRADELDDKEVIIGE